ncbi:MAG: hypothetical protein JWO87_3322 [Phycisphaerales bacterium]|jgi:hypothetical protein|nr:hypothetical protein [Phycisphaerales bacterium]MDB5301659.1 hypothetical protein [Phycisphaerales bacterium]MDB5303404.1 hypothetical protein [Phycisphaerales bacterium]
MKTEKLLGFVVVLQVLTLLGQWAGPVGSPSVARAEIANPAERQLALIDEVKNTNARLDRLIGLLQSGEVQVKVAKAEEQK